MAYSSGCNCIVCSVLHVIDSLAPGGAERMAIEIANATDKSKYRVGICVTRSNTTLAKELGPNICLYVLHRKSRFDWHGMLRFKRIAEEFGVDIFHVHGRPSMAFVALARTIGLVSQPVLFHDHYGEIERDESVPFWLKFWVKKHVFQYVGVYSQLGQWAQRAGIPQARIEVIENALNLRRILNASPLDIRHELGIPSESVVGIWIGGIRLQKGLDVLVEALHMVQLHIPFVLLIIGGVGDEEYYQSCRRQIDEYGLTDRLRFLGPREDVPSILRGVDFGVVSSVSESGPLVLIEYMAAGIPFVATSVGSISRRAQQLGVPGFVPSGDPHALANALGELLDLSRFERRERGLIGQKVAVKHFDISLQMPKWYDLYERLLKVGKCK